jgi:hypothetical protein
MLVVFNTTIIMCSMFLLNHRNDVITTKKNVMQQQYQLTIDPPPLQPLLTIQTG